MRFETDENRRRDRRRVKNATPRLGELNRLRVIYAAGKPPLNRSRRFVNRRTTGSEYRSGSARIASITEYCIDLNVQIRVHTLVVRSFHAIHVSERERSKTSPRRSALEQRRGQRHAQARVPRHRPLSPPVHSPSDISAHEPSRAETEKSPSRSADALLLGDVRREFSRDVSNQRVGAHHYHHLAG